MAFQCDNVRIRWGTWKTKGGASQSPWKHKETLEYHGTNQGIKEYNNLAQRKVTSTINSLYDVLGSVAPITITGKLIFSNVFNKKLTWDKPVPPEVGKRWTYMLEQRTNLWCLGLSRQIFQVTSNYTGFLKLATWVYVLQYTSWSTSILSLFHNIYSLQNQELQRQSVPRLELTAALQLAKLQSNILVSLENYPIKSCQCWVESVIILYWLITRVIYIV